MIKNWVFIIFFIVSFSASAKPPNIVFILIDDLGWGDVGYNGSQWVETPNIDKLAANGKVFNNAYMYPTCSPSRAALATGKHSFRTQVYNVPVLENNNSRNNIYSRWTVEAKHKFYSQVIESKGYQLGFFGKWHLVGPNPEQEKNYPYATKLTQPDNGDTGWIAKHKSDEYDVFYPRGRGYSKNVGGSWWGDPARGYDKGYKSTSGGYHAPFKNPFIEDKNTDEWLTDRLTDEAIEFIDNNQDQPFFVDLHYYTVHRPSVARSQKLLEKYQNKADEALTGKSADHPRESAAYGTLVENMDDNVGRIIAHLEESGLRDNTVIIFSSDNGFNSIQSTDKRLRGSKGTIYEGGVKVPLVVNWPNKVKPGQNNTLISVVDFFPTFADIAQTKIQKTDALDGQSFWPIATDKISADKDKAIFWHLASGYKHGPVSAIRWQDWKLIQFVNSGKLELYNLKSDMAEKNNLADVNPNIRNELLNQLVEWRKSNQVPLPAASNLTF